MKHQYSLALIQHSTNGTVIDQRAKDGYINATALCKAAGKMLADYLRLGSTKAFFDELSADMGIPISEIIQIVKGGDSAFQGTWVHPQVAIHLGQWASPKFAVLVSKWVHEWMSGRAPQVPGGALPPHLQRYLVNDSKVPAGYFSILQETALGLIGPMHMQGFDIPPGWVPDISVGKTFCKFLREAHGVNTDQLASYPHDYLDGRALVYPKLYPDSFLAEYRRWFRECWLPEYGVKYFKKRDPASLVYLDRIPALSGPATARPDPTSGGNKLPRKPKK